MTNNANIIHMQGHIRCNQNATEYGNAIQACICIIFKHLLKQAVDSMHISNTHNDRQTNKVNLNS